MRARSGLAKNEVIFRDLNERIAHIAAPHGDDHVYEFLCECSNVDCTLRLPLTLAAYEEVRAVPTQFVVAPGHELPENRGSSFPFRRISSRQKARRRRRARGGRRPAQLRLFSAFPATLGSQERALGAPSNGRQAAMRGKMVWFNAVKGFGFIRTEEDERLYVHSSGFEPGQVPVGRCAEQQVSFEREIADVEGGYQAVGVSIIEAAASGGRARLRRQR